MKLTFNHWLGAFNRQGELIHACGYESEPTEEDIKALAEELQTDIEFALTGLVYNEDYTIVNMEGDTLELDDDE